MTFYGTVRGGGGSGDGTPGEDGASAYEIAVANGFEGTEQEWLASLQGADGDTHVPDPSGEPNDRWLRTQGGALVFTDPPEGGGGGGATRLNDLEDVLAPSPSGGDILTFNVLAAEWVPAAPAGMGNLDGGSPTSVYGGVTSIDGGGVL